MQVEAGQVAVGSTLDWAEDWAQDRTRDRAGQDPQAPRVAVIDCAVDEDAPWSPPIVIWGALGAASWLPVLLCAYFLFR